MISRGRKRAATSIYQRLKEKQVDAMPLPVITHGAQSKQSHMLHAYCETVMNPRLGRIKTAADSLKMSAALHGSYSLSANQVGFPMNFFVMHRSIPHGSWLTDVAM